MESNVYVENDSYIVISKDFYDIAILMGKDQINPLNDNVDVEVRWKDGRLHTGTFFTIRNIEEIFQKNKRSGECDHGLYFYSRSMIIVEELSVALIISTIEKLVKEESLSNAFDIAYPGQE